MKTGFDTIWKTIIRVSQVTGLAACAIPVSFATSVSPANAASIDVTPVMSLPGFAILSSTIAILVFFWAIITLRRMNQRIHKDRNRVVDLETRLNETEAALIAEPGILIIWRDANAAPEQIVGDMCDTVMVPQDQKVLLDFARWLDPESATTVIRCLEKLRDIGTPFNVGIKTATGELLEADGRTAGGLATMRFRPLTGERRDNTELAYDARRLGKQVENLSAILDSAPLSIWLVDYDGQYVWTNQAYMQAVEASKIDEITQQSRRLFDPTALKPATEDDKDKASGFCGKVNAVIGGSKHILDIYELQIDDGKVGFAIDMTLLEQTQKELERHIQAHGSMLDNLTTAIAIFGPDQRLNYFNNAYSNLWSLPSAWLESKPRDGEILDKLREARRLPEQANFRDWKTAQLKTYTTLEMAENWWHLPDGQTVRVIAEQHPFGGVTYLYDNVTEKINLESRYNEMSRVQRETLDNLSEAIALFGTDGKLKLFNPPFAEFWQLDPGFLAAEPHIDEVITRCQRLFGKDTIWIDLKYTITSIGNRQAIQQRIQRPDEKVFHMASVPLPDGNTLLTFFDITDSTGIERALRERNEALEAADRLKTDFLSNVSYELRTPLNNIIGFAQALTMGIAGNMQPKQHEYLSDIQTSSHDLLAIIDAILDLTTIDAGAMELDLSTIDVSNLLQQTAQSMANWIDRRDLTVNIEIAKDVSSFIGDKRRVQQVLTNLLSNAIGFSTRAAVVRIGARQDDDHMMIWVADTGRGIAPEFQEKVFERFQSQPVSGSHRGPGLGLTIVKSFVELHDGRVSLLSQLGKGTTVVCSFPLNGPQRKHDNETSKLELAKTKPPKSKMIEA